MKPFNEAQETDSSGTEARLTAGGLLGGGLPRWSVPLRGTGYSQPQKTRTSCHSHASSRDRTSSLTSYVLGQGPPLIVIPLLDPVSSGVLG